MATLSVIHPTLLDLSRRLDPNDKIAKIVEILEPTNEMLADAVWKEGNLPTGEKTTIRTGYSTPTWRKLYGGVQPTKTTTAQVTDTCGMLEDYSEVDVALADLSNNKQDFLASEDIGKWASMSQELASTMIYGDEDLAPEEFTGFTPRFNDQSSANGENILTAAATPGGSDNSSIWLIGWGLNTCHMIYPKGSKMGLQQTFKGQVTAENIDGSNGRAEIYRTHYRWDAGLCIRDWRYVVRINFDLDLVVSTGGTGPILADLMGKAIRRIPVLGNCRPAFYASRDTLDAIDLQLRTGATYGASTGVAGSHIMGYGSVEDAQGKLVTMFRQIPLRRVDAILNTETGV